MYRDTPLSAPDLTHVQSRMREFRFGPRARFFESAMDQQIPYESCRLFAPKDLRAPWEKEQDKLYWYYCSASSDDQPRLSVLHKEAAIWFDSKLDAGELSHLAGKWIAIWDNQMVGVSRSFKKLQRRVGKKHALQQNEIFYFAVPETSSLGYRK